MPNYLVEVIIENKKLAKDPEGETIYRELINKSGYDEILSVRSGKYLRLNVNAQSKNDAEKIVYKMCNDLRIYNPVVHSCKIVAKGNIE
ncbi:MAG: phosphoribosylformylglycinamidine synthase subunit PurS [Candidatus Bathyarchaeota archaeon]|nr:phosphoribosylformylglycinamidine synthase subunit PurS [Candidatus Bathyarchaeota archaeon]MCZ2845404.1 phosphoribosylformylglycinamidine synthase subunit PurS [Candidatus Bathyarchaeota archaeon]